MNRHAWRTLIGFIKLAALFIPFWLAWKVVKSFDDIWNPLWQKTFGREFFFAGFAATILAAYLIGSLSETRLGMWLDKNVFFKIPFLKKLFISFNPEVRDLYRKAQGALIAQFMSGWRIAFITALHKTQEGCLGSVGYIGIPPIPQQLDEKSRIKVQRFLNPNGSIRYALIPRDIAWQQEVSFGVAVPRDTYLNLAEISFGDFVKAQGILDNY